MADNSFDKGLSDEADFLPDLCSAQSVLVLILIAELFVGSLMVVSYGFDRFDWARFGMVSMLAQWVVLTSAGSLCLLRGQLKKLPAVFAGVCSYALVLFYTCIFSVLIHWLSRGSMLGLGKTVLGNLLVAAVLAGVVLRTLYLQQQLRNQQRAEMQSRLQALQSRIRPHFLFNSMNTIASLIAVDQETAERVVVELSQLFRASLSEPGLIALHKEMSLCRYYVDIEQMRFGARLRVDWQVVTSDGVNLDADDQRFAQWQIPSFTLQPLIENAIYHGIQPLAEGGEIKVHVTLATERATITIVNPLADVEDRTEGIDKPAVAGNGIALDNIRHRLMAYYGKSGQLETKHEQGRFMAVLKIPHKTQNVE